MGLRTLGTVAKIVIFLVSAVEDFSIEGLCPGPVRSDSGSPTRIPRRASCLISCLLSAGNQRPPLRENPFSQRLPAEKGVTWTGFSLFLVSYDFYFCLTWADPWNRLKRTLNILLEFRAAVVFLAAFAGSSGPSLSFSFRSCCWQLRGSRPHRRPAALPPACCRLFLRFRFLTRVIPRSWIMGLGRSRL